MKRATKLSENSFLGLKNRKRISLAESFSRKPPSSISSVGRIGRMENAHASWFQHGRLPLVRVRPDCEPRIWPQHTELESLNPDTGVKRDHASIIGEQRIDVELA